MLKKVKRYVVVLSKKDKISNKKKKFYLSIYFSKRDEYCKRNKDFKRFRSFTLEKDLVGATLFKSKKSCELFINNERIKGFYKAFKFSVKSVCIEPGKEHVEEMKDGFVKGEVGKLYKLGYLIENVFYDSKKDSELSVIALRPYRGGMFDFDVFKVSESGVREKSFCASGSKVVYEIKYSQYLNKYQTAGTDYFERRFYK